MNMRFRQLAMILGAAMVIFLGSRVCNRLLRRHRPHRYRCQAAIIPNLANLPNQVETTKSWPEVRLVPKF